MYDSATMTHTRSSLLSKITPTLSTFTVLTSLAPSCLRLADRCLPACGATTPASGSESMLCNVSMDYASVLCGYRCSMFLLVGLGCNSGQYVLCWVCRHECIWHVHYIVLLSVVDVCHVCAVLSCWQTVQVSRTRNSYEKLGTRNLYTTYKSHPSFSYEKRGRWRRR